mgnify:CR=1 FL=1
MMAYNPNFNPNCGACGGLNSRGYCQFTACRFPVSKEAVITKPVSGALIKPKPKTNADRLRTMSDEELAGYLANVCYDLWKMFVADPEKMWLDWLRQEAVK